jgi:hypothetical protein
MQLYTFQVSKNWFRLSKVDWGGGGGKQTKIFKKKPNLIFENKEIRLKRRF